MNINQASFNTIAESIAFARMIKAEFVLEEMTADAYERCYQDGQSCLGVGYVLSCNGGTVSARVSDLGLLG